MKLRIRFNHAVQSGDDIARTEVLRARRRLSVNVKRQLFINLMPGLDMITYNVLTRPPPERVARQPA